MCTLLLSLKTGSSVPLHMVTHPEISMCPNTLSQNILAEKELTVFVGTALFLNDHKHYFLSSMLDCFRSQLVRNTKETSLGWSSVESLLSLPKQPIILSGPYMFVSLGFTLVTVSA